MRICNTVRLKQEIKASLSNRSRRKQHGVLSSMSVFVDNGLCKGFNTQMNEKPEEDSDKDFVFL